MRINLDDRMITARIGQRLSELHPEEFPELRAALAAVIERNKAKLIEYAWPEYEWPLEKYWCVEQVMMIALVLCLREYWTQIDRSVIDTAKKVREQANTDLAQAKAKIEKHLGPEATAHGIWRHTFFDAGIAAAARSRGRPRKLHLALFNLLKTAGLEAAAAKRHALALEERLGTIYEWRGKAPPKRG